LIAKYGIGNKIICFCSGEVVHTGLLPFIKMFVATTKSTTQNGARGGGATLHVPIWHPEIQDILVLKNNKGTEDNRERRADYSVQLSKIFYQRFLQDGTISLFDPKDCQELYDVWGSPEFDDLYLKLEKQKKYKTQVSALELFGTLFKERAETGRIYIQNIDHVNTHSPFNELVKQSNLCQEISLISKPIDDIHDTQGQIATCILSAINIGKINKISELEEVCEFEIRRNTG
jgi:ribonucleoside-diphosphate reductase alpha chain